MGRIYTAEFDNVTVSAIQDVFQIDTGSTNMAILVSCELGQSNREGDANSQMLPVLITRYATGGSGGSTPAMNKHDEGDANATAVIEANNTTQGGTPNVVRAATFNIMAGWHYDPIPDEMFLVGVSGFLCIEFPVAPSPSLTMYGSITIEELG